MDIPTHEMSWVKAAQHYFSADPHGRKIEMSEFKELTDADKDDLKAQLIALGYNIV